MEICSVCLAVAAVGFGLLAAYIWNMKEKLKTLERLGIPGPKPSLFFGNTLEHIQKGFTYIFQDWEKQYGKVYGMYRGTMPCIVVSDPDLLREIMVKRFHQFPNRQKNRSADFMPFNQMLIFLRDDHWKFVRNHLSPSFSSGKLKRMLPVIQRCCRNLTKHVQAIAESGEVVDAKPLVSAFTMDVIAGTGFGLEVDSLTNPDEPFVKVTNRVLYPPNWMLSVVITFPSLHLYLRKIGIAVAPEDALNWVMDVLKAAIKERRQDAQKHPDILQILVDAQEEEQGQQGPVDAEIDHRQQLQTSSKWNQKGLSDDEILANAFIFLLGGYETTASALSFLLFNLAANPECLEKAQREVDEKLGEGEVDYQVANELTYIEMCINESMRLYPPGFLLDRDCAEDTELGGYPVKKDWLVVIPVYAIHTDPDLWPDPLKFDPERHTPEARAARHPFAFMPFGMGPRNCIGMRLAMVEMKMAAAAILQKFSPVLCEESKYPARIKSSLRLGAEDGLPIKFEVRQK